MTHETETKLFDMLSQEFNVQALQQDMNDIEHIVCMDDIMLLSMAKGVITVCFEAMGLTDTDSEMMDRINARLAEFAPVKPIMDVGPARGRGKAGVRI